MRTRLSSWKKRSNGSKQRCATFLLVLHGVPSACFLSVADRFPFPLFKVGKAVYTREIFRRLLVFASNASTSAPTATATAYTPCHASYTNYTGDDGSIF